MRKLQMAPILADDGGRMKVVHRKDAKALKGDKSLSYQVISPDNVGSRKFLVTVVDILPGGSTPVHEHRTVEVLHPRGPRRGDVGARTQGLGARHGGLFPGRFDARDPERGEGSSSVSVLSRASVRDRRPLSELAGTRKPRDDRRLTALGQCARGLALPLRFEYPMG